MPVGHLTGLNAHCADVISSLDVAELEGLQLVAAQRQAAGLGVMHRQEVVGNCTATPSPSSQSGRAALGVSAFAFQGTNAHVTVRACDLQTAFRKQPDSLSVVWPPCVQTSMKSDVSVWESCDATQPVLQRSIVWPVPPPRPLLDVVLSQSTRNVTFAMCVRPGCMFSDHDRRSGRPQLPASLWDHIVCGRPIAPATAFLVMGAGAAASCMLHEDRDCNERIALTGVAIPAPLALPDVHCSSTGDPKRGVVMTCTVDWILQQRASVRISSPKTTAGVSDQVGTTHLQAKVEALHAVPAGNATPYTSRARTTLRTLVQAGLSLARHDGCMHGNRIMGSLDGAATGAESHPAVLDSMLQMAAIAGGGSGTDTGRRHSTPIALRVPVGMEAYVVPVAAATNCEPATEVTAAAFAAAKAQAFGRVGPQAVSGLAAGGRASTLVASHTLLSGRARVTMAGVSSQEVRGWVKDSGTGPCSVLGPDAASADSHPVDAGGTMTPSDSEPLALAQHLCYEASRQVSHPAEQRTAACCNGMLAIAGDKRPSVATATALAATQGMAAFAQTGSMRDGMPFCMTSVSSRLPAAGVHSAVSAVARSACLESHGRLGCDVVLARDQQGVRLTCGDTKLSSTSMLLAPSQKLLSEPYGAAETASGTCARRVLLPFAGPPLQRAFQLLPQPRGALSGLRQMALQHRFAQSVPLADENLLQVAAVGLNFRDVLNVLGMYPGDPGPPGGDCAGVLVEQEGGQLGAPVFGLAAGCLGTMVHCGPSPTLVPYPSLCMSPEQASSMPTVCLTVLHAFGHGRVAAGQRVLVPAAAGGVGLAAIHLLRWLGAVPVATAGSPAKRALLRGLGVGCVGSSRDTSFADDVAVTQSQVHAVLNNLTSPGMVAASLSALRPDGRFTEIGKRDVWSAQRVAQERPDITYCCLAVDFLPAVAVRAGMQHVSCLAGAGVMQPLPLSVSPLLQAPAALRTLSQARHVGKVVVSNNSPTSSLTLSKDQRFTITGGLGALGLLVAGWLVQRGAGCVTLLARSRASAPAQRALPLFNASSTCLTAATCDVGAVSSIVAALGVCTTGSTANSAVPAPMTLLHAGGVLADALLGNQFLGSLRRVGAAKNAALPSIFGMLQIVPSLKHQHLLFSSVASLLGSHGQANYASANAQLDAAARVASTCGIPVQAVQWGAWAGAGMAASDTNMASRLHRQGLSLLEPSVGLATMAALLNFWRQPMTPVTAVLPVTNWHRISEALAIPGAEYIEQAAAEPIMKLGSGQPIAHVPAHRLASNMKRSEADISAQVSAPRT
jgi:NADPH:quinone reductase-like Zn-dependent oxidoreductase